jgi:hypothetical protein
MCPKCLLVLPDRSAKSRHIKTCDGTGNESALVVKEPGTVAPTPAPTVAAAATAVPAGTGIISNHVQADTAHINNNQNNQYNILQINCFGKEDISAIMDDAYLDERLKEFNGKGIFKMVRDVHFNPDRPENQNIRIASKKSKTLRVLEEDGDWHIRANCDILELLIGKYKSILTRRSFEPNFKEKLKFETDLMQIQQDLIKFDKRSNPTGYYACAHKILALIEDLERASREET